MKKGIIEYRFSKTETSKERYYTTRYNNFIQFWVSIVKVNLKRPDHIIIHKDKN